MEYKIIEADDLPTVEVIFISEANIEEIIISKKEFEKQRKLKYGDRKGKKGVKRKLLEDDSEINSKKSKLNDSDDIELALAALEGADIEAAPSVRPTTLYNKKEDISAREIFNFLAKDEETPKPPSPEITDPELKKVADILEDKDEEEASEAQPPATPKTSVDNLKSCLKTPTSSVSKLNITFNEEPTKTPRSKLNPSLANGNTPRSVRKRVVEDIKKIQKILEDDDDEEEEDFSASGSEFELSGDSSDEDSTKPVRRKHTEDEEGCFSVTNEYFELQDMKRKSSNKKLETVKLTQNKIEEIFENIQVSQEHEESVKNLIKEYAGVFDKWEFTLEQNYNILVYGIGSKKDILTQFSKRFFDKYPVIVVNGFFPNLSIKEVIDHIGNILKISITSNVHEMIDSIEKELKENKIVIIVNNIDGLMLRGKKAQLILSRLAKINNIYMLASIDHINAPLIWDQSMLSEFNWMWCDCTTFLNYSDETNYESNILLQSSKTLTLSSLRNVFNSLTKNSKQIFLILLNYQLENQSKTYVGIAFKDLYKESRQQLLVTSDIGLRSQLKEFLDHCIVKLKKTSEGEECYYIAVDNQILKQFLEEQTG